MALAESRGPVPGEKKSKPILNFDQLSTAETMAGVVLETLSTKKLTVLVLSLLLGLVGFFLIGGFIGKSRDEAEGG